MPSSRLASLSSLASSASSSILLFLALIPISALALSSLAIFLIFGFAYNLLSLAAYSIIAIPYWLFLVAKNIYSNSTLSPLNHHRNHRNRNHYLSIKTAISAASLSLADFLLKIF